MAVEGAQLRSVASTTNPGVVIETVKPAENGSGTVLRLWNPTDRPVRTAVTCGLPQGGWESVRLDEEPDGGDLETQGASVLLDVPARGLRTLRLVRPDGEAGA